MSLFLSCNAQRVQSVVIHARIVHRDMTTVFIVFFRYFRSKRSSIIDTRESEKTEYVLYVAPPGDMIEGFLRKVIVNGMELDQSYIVLNT